MGCAISSGVNFDYRRERHFKKFLEIVDSVGEPLFERHSESHREVRRRIYNRQEISGCAQDDELFAEYITPIAIDLAQGKTVDEVVQEHGSGIVQVSRPVVSGDDLIGTVEITANLAPASLSRIQVHSAVVGVFVLIAVRRYTAGCICQLVEHVHLLQHECLKRERSVG